ncbi:MAG: TerC family protein [Candidatus Sulfotelmatobacter sp.]
MTGHLFPFLDYWWFYAAFTGFVVAFLVLDLGVFHRKAHEIGFREASAWTVVWAALALLFCLGLYKCAVWKFGATTGKQIGVEFLTGYVVEWSLSLDNMFVFVLVFRYLGTPALLQHRILFYGILGALIFRGVFVVLGAELLQCGWVVILFGVFLILTGIQMMFSGEPQIKPEQNLLVRGVRRLLPVAPESEEPRFFLWRNGKLFATPILLTLVFIEATDVLFAVDSVPAIFAITREPLVVYTSNVFAILGLRAMYFLLAGALARFHLLRYGLALILILVGLKMSWLNAAWQGHFPSTISLALIVGILAVSIGLSLVFPVSRPPKDVPISQSPPPVSAGCALVKR